MDRQWIKNLAQSTYTPHGWQLVDQNYPAHMAHEYVQSALPQLFDKLRSHIEIFNLHAPAFKQLKLFKLSRSTDQNKFYGFTILVNLLQVQLEQEGACFKTNGIILQGSQSQHIPMRSFEAHYDTFGDVFWVMDKKIAMDLNRLAKQLLEDVCRLAYEIRLFEA
jgi:hypothetical protein